MRNPFHREESAPPTVVFDNAGWSTTVQRRVPRPDKAPLYFQMRIPDGTWCIEVADLVAAARDAPAYLAGQAEALSQAADRGGAALVAALTPADQPQDILATVTVAFSSHHPHGEVPKSAPPDGVNVIEHTMVHLSDDATLEDLLYVVPSDVPDDATAVLLNQYFLRSSYGALVVAFMTAHQDSMLGDYGKGFFRELMKTVWIGETPAPADM